jgi:carbonic anhydrase
MSTRGRFLLATAAISASLGGGTAALAAGGPVVPSSETPDDLLRRLQEGNRRFVAGDLPDPKADQAAQRRAVLVEGQAPGIAVLSCADSRVVPNLMFLEGAGDLFVCRVAGNFASDDILGSMEYAVAVLKARLIVVVGHEKCGAVQAVYDALAKNEPMPPHLDAIEAGMRAGIKPVVAANGTMNDAVIANVKANVAKIGSDSAIIKPAIKDGTVKVVGGEYYLGTGRVVFFA